MSKSNKGKINFLLIDLNSFLDSDPQKFEAGVMVYFSSDIWNISFVERNNTLNISFPERRFTICFMTDTVKYQTGRKGKPEVFKFTLFEKSLIEGIKEKIERLIPDNKSEEKEDSKTIGLEKPVDELLDSLSFKYA